MSTLTLRTQDELQGEYARAVAALKDGYPSPKNPRSARHQRVTATAVRDSLAWVLGETEIAPWTGRTLPNPEGAQLFSEWAKAEAVNQNAALSWEDIAWSG